jgi:hypothetical protein
LSYLDAYHPIAAEATITFSRRYHLPTRKSTGWFTTCTAWEKALTIYYHAAQRPGLMRGLENG